jgi:simple sugar transport system permease protein
VIWGNPALQGLDVGIFVSLLAAVAFWAIMHRSTLGYEVRAVGHNPDAAQGAGISVARNYILTMVICGAFAALAASIDVLGWQFQVSSADISTSQVGFLGIAVALLGRNTALGTVFSALLFGAIETGTSPGTINSATINPELAPQLTYVIEGLVVLLVSTDLIAVRLLGLPRKLGWGGPGPASNLGEELAPDDPSLDAAEALRPEPGL